MIKIGSITSTASATSNGQQVTDHHESIAIGDVQVVDSNGTPHRATIDDHGIHVEDPNFPHEVNKDFSNVLNYLLGRAGITISTLDTTETSDGAIGNAFAGGLLVDFDSGPCEICLGTILGQLPPQVADALGQITGPLSQIKECPFPAPLPCVTIGLIPTSPQVAGTVTIASAAASVSAALPEALAGGGSQGPATGAAAPPAAGAEVAGAQFAAPSGGAPASSAVTGTTPTAGVLTGLQSKMPAGLLAGLGAGLLVVAMGLLVGPSFRRST
jgi:hypothetical protein